MHMYLCDFRLSHCPAYHNNCSILLIIVITNGNNCNNVCDVETAEAAGVPSGAGGLHQRRAEKPEEGISSRTGGGETNPERSACDWPVSGGRRSEQRHCGINHR